MHPKSCREPGGHKAREVRLLVTVDQMVGLEDKALLLAKGPNYAGTLH